MDSAEGPEFSIYSALFLPVVSTCWNCQLIQHVCRDDRSVVNQCVHPDSVKS